MYEMSSSIMLWIRCRL